MFEIKYIYHQKDWESYLDYFPEANFLQSFNWGLFQKDIGETVWRMVISQNKKPLLAAQFYLVKAKRGPHFACPGGPLFNKEQNDFWPLFLHEIKELAHRQKVWFWRCRPQIIRSEKNMSLFGQLGFVTSPMHMTADLTLQLDLTKDLDQIMANMRKNTRYLIRRVLKSDLKVKVNRDSDEVKKLYRLQLATQHKQGFVPFGLNFLQKQFDAFVKDNNCSLYSVYDSGRLCAMAMIIFYRQEAVYHYAGMNELGYKNNASYLIQWRAIKDAKQKGCKSYNFWGIAPTDKPNHRFAGVSLFKRGFGGDEVHYLPAHDYPFSYLYQITRQFEKIRKQARRL